MIDEFVITVSLMIAALILLIASGVYFRDYLAPRSKNLVKTFAIPPGLGQTQLDCLIAPLILAHPDENAACLLQTGYEALDARARSIALAGRSLDLQYYVWSNDFIGRFLIGEILSAAERGVKIRILLDDLHHAGQDPDLLALSRHPNVEIRMYNSCKSRGGIWRFLELIQRLIVLNHRMHNKCWIVDGRLAIIGGRNIAADYFDAGAHRNFSDLDLMLIGPAVEQASRQFDQYWNCRAAMPIAEVTQATPKPLEQFKSDLAAARELAYARRLISDDVQSDALSSLLGGGRAPHWVKRLEVLSDPPMKWRRNNYPNWLAIKLMPILRRARNEILLTSPYFVPRRNLSRFLKRAARAGLNVRLETNSLAATDVLAVHGGYMKHRGGLLRAGVKIFEMRAKAHARAKLNLTKASGASLHTKSFILDGSTGFVGSFNLDPRSARLNTEMGVLFHDEFLGAQLRARFMEATQPQHSYEVQLGARSWTGRRGLIWRDASQTPARLLSQEPDSALSQRLIVTICRWLPIEQVL